MHLKRKAMKSYKFKTKEHRLEIKIFTIDKIICLEKVFILIKINLFKLKN